MKNAAAHARGGRLIHLRKQMTSSHLEREHSRLFYKKTFIAITYSGFSSTQSLQIYALLGEDSNAVLVPAKLASNRKG